MCQIRFAGSRLRLFSSSFILLSAFGCVLRIWFGLREISCSAIPADLTQKKKRLPDPTIRNKFVEG